MARYVHFPYEILTTPSEVMYEHKHDMYSVGIAMWELFNIDQAYRKEISSLSNQPATLRDFAEYLKRGHSIRTYSEKELSPSRVWKDMTESCLTFEIGVNELLEWQVKAYRKDCGASTPPESKDTTTLYCLIKWKYCNDYNILQYSMLTQDTWSIHLKTKNGFRRLKRGLLFT